MVITNARIVLIDRIIEEGYVSFSNGIITEIKDEKYSGNDDVLDAQNMILMPGFIDLHIHGIAGIDFMDAGVNDYDKITSSLLNQGVTSFLVTTLTSDQNSLIKVANTVKDIKTKHPSILGIHLEGPYLNLKYVGAQNEKYLRCPNIQELEELILNSGNNIRKVTIAPELDGSQEFIKFSKENIC